MNGICIFLGTVMSVGLALPSPARAESALEKCYSGWGEVEETVKGGKKVTRYKSEADVAEECNAKIIAKAKSEPSKAKILELATVIGTKSNWANALPVFELAAKKDNEICANKEATYSVSMALSRPSDDKPAKEAFQFLRSCWPKSKEVTLALLEKSEEGYEQKNLCAFLKEKDPKAVESSGKCTAK